MQLGTSDNEAVLGDQNASERDEMEDFQDLQEELDSSYLEYLGMQSMYEDKCAEYKELQRMHRKMKRRIVL